MKLFKSRSLSKEFIIGIYILKYNSIQYIIFIYALTLYLQSWLLENCSRNLLMIMVMDKSPTGKRQRMRLKSVVIKRCGDGFKRTVRL